MKERIEIIVLSHCDLCKKLIREFGMTGLKYSIIDAYENSKLCDEVEALLGIDNYPIVIVSYGDLKQYHYLSADSDRFSSILSTGDKATAHRSIESIINYFS